VARYVVDVMPKREILDPQGKAVLGALPRLGFEGVTDVRQGKRFEIEVDGDADEARLADVRRMAETLLANPVIEDFTVTADDAQEPFFETPRPSAPQEPSFETPRPSAPQEPSFETPRPSAPQEPSFETPRSLAPQEPPVETPTEEREEES
jgi:phosphoribosylformylglycinamidine synthase subunit PurS